MGMLTDRDPQFTVARITPYMLSGSVDGLFYFVFAACTVVSATVVWFLLPETKGRSLESMDEIFGSPYTSSRGPEMEAAE